MATWLAQAITRGEHAELRTTLPAASRMLAVVTHRERKLGAGGDAFLWHCFEAVGNVSNYESYRRAMQGNNAVPRGLFFSERTDVQDK